MTHHDEYDAVPVSDEELAALVEPWTDDELDCNHEFERVVICKHCGIAKGLPVPLAISTTNSWDTHSLRPPPFDPDPNIVSFLERGPKDDPKKAWNA